MGSIFQKPPNNYQYYVGQSNLVNYRFDTVNQTAPVTNGALHNNLVIPAKTFIQEGQMLTIYLAGNMGAHAGTTVTIIIQLNGVTILTGGYLANAAATEWEIYIRMICTSIANNQVVCFGTTTVGGNQASSSFGTLTIFGTRNFLNPFGNGVNADNTLQVLVTDAGGAEVITQEITHMMIQ